MSDLIVSRGITKTFHQGGKAFSVLKGIDLTIRRGDLLAVVGASGAGKSTLLNVLGLLSTPTAGTLLWEGRNTAELKPDGIAALRNREIGFVFQFHHLLPDFTAAENVMMPSLIAPRAPASAAEQRARELLARVGLARQAGQRPGELSGGEQQRVALARALMNSPQVLLADEPTGNLDKANAEAVFGLIRELHEKDGLTVVMVTHNEAFARRAETVLHMEDGKII